MTLSLSNPGHWGEVQDPRSSRTPLAEKNSESRMHREVSWGERIPQQVSRFLREASEPSMAVGMAFGLTAFNSARALIQPALMRSSISLFSKIPFVTRFTSAALATVPEVGTFWGSSKLIQEIHRPGSVHIDGATAAYEMFHLGTTLGLLKCSGFLFGRLGALARKNQIAWLPQSPMIWNQSGMLAGIMASHGLEISQGQRAASDLSKFVMDALITLGQFNAGGALSHALFPALYRANAMLQQRMAAQERTQWEKLREDSGDFFGSGGILGRSLAPVEGILPGGMRIFAKGEGPYRDQVVFNEGGRGIPGATLNPNFVSHPEVTVKGPFPERTGGPLDPFEETGSTQPFPREMMSRLVQKSREVEGFEGKGAENAVRSIIRELDFKESDPEKVDPSRIDRISEKDFGLALGSALRRGMERYEELRQGNVFEGKRVSEIEDLELRLWVWQMDHLMDVALYVPRAGKSKAIEGLREGMGEFGRARLDDLKAGLIGLLSPQIGRDVIGPRDGALAIGWGEMLATFALLRHRIMPGVLSWRYQLVTVWESPETAKEIREQGTHRRRLGTEKRIHYAHDPKVLAIGKNDQFPITAEQALSSFQLQFLNIKSNLLHGVLNQNYIEKLPRDAILVEGIKGWVGKDRGEYKPTEDEQQTLLPFELIQKALDKYRRDDVQSVHMAGFIPSAKLWFHHSGGMESANPRPRVVFAGKEDFKDSNFSPAATLVKELFVGRGKGTPYLMAEASHKQPSSELGGAMKNIVSLLAGMEAVRFGVEWSGKDLSRLNMKTVFDERFLEPHKKILLDTLRRENIIKKEENIEFEGPVIEDLERCLLMNLPKIREMYEEILLSEQVPLHDSRAFAKYILERYLPRYSDYTATRNPFLGVIIEVVNQLRTARGATIKVSEVVEAIRESKAFSLEGADSIAPFIARNIHKAHRIELRRKPDPIYDLHDLLHPNTPADRVIIIPPHLLKALRGTYPSIDIKLVRETLEGAKINTVLKLEKELAQLDKLLELAQDGNTEPWLTEAIERQQQFIPHYFRASKMGKPQRVIDLPHYELPYQNAARITLGSKPNNIQGYYSYLRADGAGILSRLTQLGMYLRSLPTDTPHVIQTEVTGLSGRENAKKYWEVQNTAREILGAFVRYKTDLKPDLKIEMFLDGNPVVPDLSPRVEIDQEAYYQALMPLVDRLNRNLPKNPETGKSSITPHHVRRARVSQSELLEKFVQSQEGWPSLVKYYGGPMQRALKSGLTRPEKQTLIGVYSPEGELIDTFMVYRSREGRPMALSHSITKAFQEKMSEIFEDISSVDFFDGFVLEEFLTTYETMLARENRGVPDYRIIDLKSLPLEMAMAGRVPGVNPMGLRAFLKAPSEARDKMLRALDPLYEQPFEDITDQAARVITQYLDPFERQFGELLDSHPMYRWFKKHPQLGYERLIVRAWTQDRIAATRRNGLPK